MTQHRQRAIKQQAPIQMGSNIRAASALPSLVVLSLLLNACLPTDRPGSEKTRKPVEQQLSDSKDPNERLKFDRPLSFGKLTDPKKAEEEGPGEKDPILNSRFEDQFERSALGANYRLNSPNWHIKDGQLCVSNARNHPAWLKRRLPTNALIEFDVTSQSDDGDIKVEIWGDGSSGATGVSYSNATSYLAIFGGWKNSLHVLARLDEHGSDRKELRIDPDGPLRSHKVEKGKKYHFSVERNDGKTVKFQIDGVLIHSMIDPFPLSGTGHDHMGFNNWTVPTCFDNLKITPLK